MRQILNTLNVKEEFENSLLGINPFLIDSNEVSDLAFTVSNAYYKTDPDSIMNVLATNLVNSCKSFTLAIEEIDLEAAKYSLILLRLNYIKLNRQIGKSTSSDSPDRIIDKK